MPKGPLLPPMSFASAWWRARERVGVMSFDGDGNTDSCWRLGCRVLRTGVGFADFSDGGDAGGD